MAQPTGGQITQIQAALANNLRAAGAAVSYSAFDPLATPSGRTIYVQNIAYVDLGSNNWQINFDAWLNVKYPDPTDRSVTEEFGRSANALQGKNSLSRSGLFIPEGGQLRQLFTGGQLGPINAP